MQVSRTQRSGRELITGHRRNGSTAASMGWIGAAPSTGSGQSWGMEWSSSFGVWAGSCLGVYVTLSALRMWSCSPGARTRVFFGEAVPSPPDERPPVPASSEKLPSVKLTVARGPAAGDVGLYDRSGERDCTLAASLSCCCWMDWSSATCCLCRATCSCCICRISLDFRRDLSASPPQPGGAFWRLLSPTNFASSWWECVNVARSHRRCWAAPRSADSRRCWSSRSARLCPSSASSLAASTGRDWPCRGGKPCGGCGIRTSGRRSGRAGIVTGIPFTRRVGGALRGAAGRTGGLPEICCPRVPAEPPRGQPRSLTTLGGRSLAPVSARASRAASSSAKTE
eukprot:Hpha_TRINITY_DN15219_c1_g4::TRINITY_DN15219_c1_g4_i1::g.65386::m.65386